MSTGGQPRRFIGALAAIVAAIEGAILLSRKAEASNEDTPSSNNQAPPGQKVVQIPQALMDLVIAIAHGIGGIIEAVERLVVGEGTFPNNSASFTAIFVPCANAQPDTVRLPDIAVPRGMRVDILARNPGGVNAGVIYLSPTANGAAGNQLSRPLVAGATIQFRVKNVGAIHMGATVAGDGVFITVEAN